MRRSHLSLVSYLVASSISLNLSFAGVFAQSAPQIEKQWQLLEHKGQEAENKFDNEKAKKYYQQALAPAAKLGSDSNQKLQTMAHICNACVMEKQISEAETYYLALIKLVQEKKTKNSKLKHSGLSDGLMSAMDDLADSYFNCSSANKIDMMKHALRLRELISGDVHPEMSKNLWAIVLHYYRLKDYFKAEPYADKLVSIDSKKLAADDMNLGIEYQTLGTIKGNNLKYGDAESYLRQAIAVYSSSNNMKILESNMVKSELALVLMKKNDFDKAEKVASEAVHFFEAKYGKSASQAVGTRNILASIQMKKKNYKKAQENLLMSLSSLESNFGIDQEVSLSTLKQLQTCYEKSGNASKAKAMAERIKRVEFLMSKAKSRN
ncbi:MAG: hypothetical protein SFY67_14805 [Candidatus Melainabacteria bacterium]|nr:hypothetical protein [Candidatus Melainabacteria bacterium]